MSNLTYRQKLDSINPLLPEKARDYLTYLHDKKRDFSLNKHWTEKTYAEWSQVNNAGWMDHELKYEVLEDPAPKYALIPQTILKIAKTYNPETWTTLQNKIQDNLRKVHETYKSRQLVALHNPVFFTVEDQKFNYYFGFEDLGSSYLLSKLNIRKVGGTELSDIFDFVAESACIERSSLGMSSPDAKRYELVDDDHDLLHKLIDISTPSICYSDLYNLLVEHKTIDHLKDLYGEIVIRGLFAKLERKSSVHQSYAMAKLLDSGAFFRLELLVRDDKLVQLLFLYRMNSEGIVDSASKFSEVNLTVPEPLLQSIGEFQTNQTLASFVNDKVLTTKYRDTGSVSHRSLGKEFELFYKIESPEKATVEKIEVRKLMAGQYTGAQDTYELIENEVKITQRARS